MKKVMENRKLSYDVGGETTYKKKIMIIGANSYIGNAVEEYLSLYTDYYDIKKIQARGLIPETELFKGYDVVLDTAGIAHVKETEKNRNLYYEVNRDLTIKIAETSKNAGVKQFILLSSMSVYGKITGYITKTTEPNPTNAYGDSKLQADNIVKNMNDDSFKVAILRPPMVYGKKCRGNYQSLRKFALKSPIFPNYDNIRSMIFIGNLCEFIKCIIDRNDSGLFFPQNKDYVKTSDMVLSIAKQHNKKIIMLKIFNPVIKMCPGKLIKKVFGSLTYEKTDLIEKFDFQESIALTEGYERGESNGK